MGYNYHLEELVYADAGFSNYGETSTLRNQGEAAKGLVKKKSVDWLTYFGIGVGGIETISQT